MKNLICFIDTYFRKVRPEDAFIELDLLNKTPNKKEKSKYTLLNDPHKEALRKNLHFKNFNNNELDNLFSYISNNFLNLEHVKGLSLFNLLVNFSSEVLMEEEDEPECRQQYILEWAEICRNLGEEIFTCPYFAYNDLFKKVKNRSFFAWKPVLASNDPEIKTILKKGLAENHFHLHASAPNFMITWIFLMNNFFANIVKFKLKDKFEEFVKFEQLFKLEPEIIIKFDYKLIPLYELVKRAYFIRAFLYFKFICTPKSEKEWSKFNHENEKAIMSMKTFEAHSDTIQEQLINLTSEYSLPFYIDNKEEYLDYAIPKKLTPENYNGNLIYYGERYFLYEAFKKIFLKQIPEKYKQLLYVYLIIKAKFREEIIQLNDYPGLGNFKNYNNRKSTFIPDNTVYDKLTNYLAFNSCNKKHNIVSLEARIMAEKDEQKFLSTLERINESVFIPALEEKGYERYKKMIDELSGKIPVHEKNHFFVVHLSRMVENISKSTLSEKINFPRDYRLRVGVKEFVLSLVNLREDDNKQVLKIEHNKKKAALDVIGIDVAGSEIGCRPEVFAQAYRFLKNLDCEKEDVPQLNFTYHVGEDFLDVVDALRAIDEALEFLNLGNRDRLGHALALGIDIKDFYRSKNNTISIPKHDLLDNIVWLLSNLEIYSIKHSPELAERLKEEYKRLFKYIYRKYIKEKKVVPCYLKYFNSWQLRGDNPYHYFEKKFKNILPIGQWNDFSINENYPKSSVREDEEVNTLCYYYHFDKNAMLAGVEIEKFLIDKKYITVVEEIQKKMQTKVAERCVGVETCPTSNLIVGTFKDYAKHPITKFYNQHLETCNKKLMSCPQLFVSINTDDQGIFNTSLENEYALLAQALDREVDKNGEKLYKSEKIYDWLDKIREMGIQQSFNLSPSYFLGDD